MSKSPSSERPKQKHFVGDDDEDTIMQKMYIVI